jgi:hypothetical protein
MEMPMRIVLATLAAVLLVVTAQAQPMKGKRGANPSAGQAQSDDIKKKKERAEEKAAKSALDRLPDKSFDPWRTMR